MLLSVVSDPKLLVLLPTLPDDWSTSKTVHALLRGEAKAEPPMPWAVKAASAPESVKTLAVACDASSINLEVLLYKLARVGRASPADGISLTTLTAPGDLEELEDVLVSGAGREFNSFAFSFSVRPG
jgi:hypothetical protein